MSMRLRIVAACRGIIAASCCLSRGTDRQEWRCRRRCRDSYRIPVVGVFGHRPLTQADLALGWTQLDDLELAPLAELEIDPRLVLAIGVVELRNMAQAFDPFFDFDEHPEWRVTHDPCL